MKKTSIYLFILVGLISCNETKEDRSKIEESEKEIVSEKIEYVSFGEKITPDGALKAEGLEIKLQDKDTLQVKLEAVINETCSKKGCWMSVDIGGENDMLVRFKDYGFFVPKEGQQGKTAIFSGRAFRDTVSIETLRHYAEDAGKPKEEIEKINKPEISIAFIADGVIIKE